MGHQHPHPDPDKFQHPGFEKPFNGLKRRGIFTRHTAPADIVETGQLAVYLDALIDAIGDATGVDRDEIADAVERSVRDKLIEDLED